MPEIAPIIIIKKRETRTKTTTIAFKSEKIGKNPPKNSNNKKKTAIQTSL